MFLVKVFTEGKKVVGKAFFSKERFVLKEKMIVSFRKRFLLKRKGLTESLGFEPRSSGPEPDRISKLPYDSRLVNII